MAALLAPEPAGLVAAHLASCAECRIEVALLEQPPAPSPLGRLARAGARLLQATLQPAPAQATALRGAASTRLVYAVGDYQLVLAVVPGDAPRAPAQIEGQLLGAEAALSAGAATATLSRAGAPAQTGPLDELGFFAFDGLPTGSYALALDLADTQIVVEPISVP